MKGIVYNLIQIFKLKIYFVLLEHFFRLASKCEWARKYHFLLKKVFWYNLTAIPANNSTFLSKHTPLCFTLCSCVLFDLGHFFVFFVQTNKSKLGTTTILLCSKKYILRPCHIVHILRYCRDSVTTYLIDQSPKINMPSSNTFTLGYVKKWKMRQKKKGYKNNIMLHSIFISRQFSS